MITQQPKRDLVNLIMNKIITQVLWVERESKDDINEADGFVITLDNELALVIKGGGCSGNDCMTISLVDIASGKELAFDEKEY